MKTVAQWILSLAIVGGALAWGAVHPISYLLVETSILAVFLFLLLQQIRNGKIEIPFVPILGLLVLLVAIQIIPLPETVTGWISPHRLLDVSPDSAPAGESATPISIYPHATKVALLKLLAYLMAFSLAAYLFDSRKRPSILIWALIGLGLFESIFGLVQYFTGWEPIFSSISRYYPSNATGSYIHYTHFAGLLELTFPLLFGWVYYAFQKSRRYPRGGRLPDSSSHSGAVPFFLVLLLPMLVALVFSRWRTPSNRYGHDPPNGLAR